MKGESNSHQDLFFKSTIQRYDDIFFIIIILEGLCALVVYIASIFLNTPYMELVEKKNKQKNLPSYILHFYQHHGDLFMAIVLVLHPDMYLKNKKKTKVWTSKKIHCNESYTLIHVQENIKKINVIQCHSLICLFFFT